MMRGGFLVMIPARFGATRFPGKPLAMLAGEPMIRHVWNRAVESGADRVIVATDDPRIAEACEHFGAEVRITGASHQSGTDRLAEVATALALEDGQVVVNLQGDEPLMPPAHIATVAEALQADPGADMATLATALADPDQLHDPNVVKLVCNREGHALYFSRAPLPWDRANGGRPADMDGFLRHLGIYAYRAGFLRRFPELDPPWLERLESLEQLRALWHGARIAVARVDGEGGVGVDTPADLARAEAALARFE